MGAIGNMYLLYEYIEKQFVFCICNDRMLVIVINILFNIDNKCKRAK